MNKQPKAKNIIGKRIAEARHLQNPPLTQDAFSGRLAAIGTQLDRAAIAKIENGHRRVFDHEVKALAKALRVKLDWLFTGND